MIVPLVLAALALAYANGANDNLKATATLYGAGAVDYEQSRRLATTAQILGSLASVVLAGVLLQAFRGKGLVPAEVVANPAFLVAVGTGAATTVLANAVASALVIGASLLGSPVSTTHVSTGALFGIGLSNDSTRWHAVGGIVAAWVVTLPVSALLAAGTVWLIAG